MDFLSKYLSDENRKKIVNYLFYAALTIELVLMIVEKSEIVFSYESYVYRVTFLLTFLAVLVMKHDKKEWIAIILVLAFTFFCYRHSGKNDLLRLSVFLMAARDIDLNKAMKYCFYVTVTGFVMIFLMAVFGILGDIALVGDFGRQNPYEKRYVFGFGHPNTLFGCFYAVLLMWVWIYGKTAKWWAYAVTIGLTAVIVYLTRSRTGAVICVLTLFLAILARIFKGLGKVKILYVLGCVFAPITCIGLTIAAAWAASKQYIDNDLDPYFWTIEGKIGYRISNLYYGAEDRGGVLYRWKLFAGHGSDSYFDMGWARLFYWYGIIPTVLITLCIFIVVYVSCKKRDLWTLILVVSLSIYTLAEATYVTPYFGRDFFLLIGGVYLGEFFSGIFHKKDKDKGELNVREA
ncbi:MAG: hypothetical protein IJU77_10590 [Butyrivibrio sp.]|nr:hypothetical protein [Butyrivibrio sp.]